MEKIYKEVKDWVNNWASSFTRRDFRYNLLNIGDNNMKKYISKILNWLLDVLSEWFVHLDHWSGGSSKRTRREEREFDAWLEKAKKDPNIKDIVIAGRRY